jgi:hypothetical protein
MAPEQARDSHVADIRSDLYSLGCTFYYLLTGQVPFPHDSWSEKLLAHLFDAPVPLLALRPDLPSEVAGIVQRLMAKEPIDRFQTPADLAVALHNWLSTQDLSACSLVVPPALASDTSVSVNGPTLLSPSPVAPAHNSELSQINLSDKERWLDHEDPLPKRNAKPLSWRRITWPLSIALAITAGLFAAWLVGAMLEREANARADAPVLPPTFQLRSRPLAVLATLEDALTRAQDGDTLIIRGHGPYWIRPTTLRKALTIKAGPGWHPCIELLSEKSVPGWRPLLTTDHPLTLQGLELSRSSSSLQPGTAHLVCSEQAPLRLIGCTLLAPHGRALVVCRRTSAAHLEGCRIQAHASAVCLEINSGTPAELTLVDNTLTAQDSQGAALTIWPTDQGPPAAVRLWLEGNTVEAGRVLSLSGSLRQMEITATDNTFRFQEALLSCAGLSEPERWQQALQWHGRQNRYQSATGWLSVNGQVAQVRGLAGWRELMRSEEADSVEQVASFPRPSADSVSTESLH